MKKYLWIATIAFLLGLVIAGYIFTDKSAKDRQPAEQIINHGTTSPVFNSKAFAAQSENKLSLDFVSIYEKISPAVVKIESKRKEQIRGFGLDQEWPFEDFFDRFFGTPRPRDREQIQTAQGTGFFVSSDGFILTNNHIVENSFRVEVQTKQGETYEAEIKGRDPRTDIALLKIKIKNAPFVELGDSSQTKVGEWVLAIGNPYGFENTMTAGIVSAKGRRIGSASIYEDFIQTDAAINRGNSGGPLINLRGEVIGITSVILSPSGGNIGIGFAIPSTMAKKVIDQLKEKGRVVRGRLGVMVGNITDGMVKQFKLPSKKGAIISSIDPGSPAEKANLKQYDVIISLDGQQVEDMNDCRFKIAEISPGKKVAIKIIRDGKEMTVYAVLEELDPEIEKAEPKASEKDIGLSLTPLTPTIARRYNLRTTEGLLITNVKPGTPAYEANLEPGLIIIEANRKKVVSIRDFEKILEQVEPGDEVILLVRRESDRSFQDVIVPIRVR